MAFPVVLVDHINGSDTQASGAGPATAHFGADARTQNTNGELKVGLLGFTGDLSNVSTDGSHVLYTATAGATQRKFGSIAGIKNTRQTSTCNTTNASAVITNIGSTTGWTTDDVISITAAGPSGGLLVARIVSIDSATQVTLTTAASSTGTGRAVENPKQVTLTSGEGTNTGTTNTEWAIGGRRATLNNVNTRYLCALNTNSSGDMMPGWTLRFVSGHVETLTSEMQCRRNGDNTSGPITIEGEEGTTPLIIANFNGNAFRIVNAFVRVMRNLRLQNTNATKTSSNGIIITTNANATLEKIDISDATNYFTTGLNSDGGGNIFKDCVVKHCSTGVRVSSQTTVTNSTTTNCFTHGLFILGTAGGVVLTNNLIVENTIGILDQRTGATISGLSAIMKCTISNNTSHGIEYTSEQARAFFGVISDNDISNNGGAGIRFSSGSFNTLMFAGEVSFAIQNNNMYNNSGGRTNPDVSVYETHSLNINPMYRNVSIGDYTPTNPLLKLGRVVNNVPTNAVPGLFNLLIENNPVIVGGL